MPTLTFTTGPLAGRRIDIEGDVVVGREAADLIIENAEVSRRHAILRSAAGGIAVEDLSSRNGTFIDDVRVDGAALVPDGATLRFGPVAMQVAVETVDPGATRVSPVADPSATRISDASAVPPAPRSDPVTAIEEVPAAPAPPAPVTAPPAQAPPPAPAPAATTPAPAPAPAAPAPAAPAPAAPAPVPAAAGAGLAVDQPFGSFQPPSRQRHRGVATRLWLPAAVSFAVIIATAAALVIYFAGR